MGEDSAKRATMAEVAELAGVGLSTVSRVLRGAGSVSEKTRKRVEDVVAETGYRVDAVAQTLRNSGSLDLIAFVTPDIADPYFAEIYRNLQRTAIGRGDSLLVGSHAEDIEVQREVLRHLTGYRPAAIALVPAPGTTPNDIAMLQQSGTSVVVLDRPVPGARVDAVLAENATGAELLVENLRLDEREKVGIAMLPHDVWTQAQRLSAVRDALERRGHELVMVVEEPALAATTSSAFAEFAESGLSTVIALSVPPAMGTILSEIKTGATPARVGCFDRHPWFDAVRPGIVTVSQDPVEVANQVDFHISRRRRNPGATTITSVLAFRLDGEPNVDGHIRLSMTEGDDK